MPLRYLAAISLLMVLGFAAMAPQAVAAPLPGTISGTVTAAVGGGQLVGIPVYAYRQSTIGWEYAQFAVTDVDGDYSLTGLLPGTYRVFFSDNDGVYLSEYYSGSRTEVGASSVAVADGAVVPGIDATMDLAGRISGHVTELAGGTDLFDIQVAVYEVGADPLSAPYAWTLTDVNGLYSIGGLPTGLYVVKFTDWTQAYAPEFYSGVFSAGAAAPVPVTEPDTTGFIDAALSSAATITGKVTYDGVNGIEGVTVVAYQNVVGENYEWQSEAATTDSQGNYTLVGIPTGDFVVGFYDGSGLYVPQYFYDGAYLIQDGTPVSATVGAETPGIDAVLAQFGTISGTVTAADTGFDMVGEWVEVYRENAGVWQLTATVTTIDDGTYDTGPIPPGTYRVRFGAQSIEYKPEYYLGALLESEATSVTVDPGEMQTGIDASLDPVDTVMTLSSANQPAPATVGLGTTHVVDGFTLGRTAGAAALAVTDVTITDAGTAPASDVVAGVAVYRDNGDGTFDASDALLNSTQGTFGGDSATVTFDAPESVTTTQQYWTVYEFANVTANGGDTASSLVTAVTVTGANSVINDAVTGSTFTIDAHGPDVSIWVPGSDEVLFQDPATILGSASDLSGVEAAEVRITRSDGQFWNGTAWGAVEMWLPAVLDATGTVDTGFSYEWAFEPDVQDGSPSYEIDARASNALGSQNLGYALPVTNITIENTPPTVAITSLVNGAVLTGSSAEVTGTASDTSGVFSVYLTIQRDSDGAYWDGLAWNAFPANITVDGTDNWSYIWSPFDPAYQKGTETYTVVAYAGDYNYNTGTSPAVTGVTIDNAIDVTVTATGVDKTYDGTTAAQVTLSSADFVIGDDVRATYTAAVFADKNVDTGKSVTVSGISLAGTDAHKYDLLNTMAGTTADISARDITGAFTAADKVYDGNTDAAVLSRSLVGTLTGDAVTLDGGLAHFDTSSVGTGKTVTLLGATLVGTDADNYTLTSVADTTADITVRELTGSFTAADRIYDGTTDASVVTSSVVVVVPGDEVRLTGGTLSFDDKNVGDDKTVTWVGATLIGADASNYTLAVGPISTTADIGALDITGAFTAADKVYDGNTDAAVLTRSLVGTLTGDVVTLDGGLAHFDTSSVGTGKTVTLVGAALAGTDADNYTLTSVADTTADITVRPVTVTADDASKTVDAADPELTYSVTSGSLVAGDAFTGALTRTAGETAGTYPITKGTLALTANYDLTFVPGTFTIINKPVDRLAGDTRYYTSTKIAEDMYPGWVGVTHVVLASGEDRSQPDALTAAGLAGVLDAPLLLVPYASLNNAIEDAVGAMPAGVQVHIVGGTSAVSAVVEAQLSSFGNVADVDRVAGSTRYGTAAEVARRMRTELVAQGQTLPTTALITNGNTPGAMFDALSASAVSAHNHYPVLLVKVNAVPSETSAALADLGLDQRYIVGGTAAVDTGVASILGVASTDRIAGATRYSTATAVAERAKAEGWLSNIIVGFAAQIPDAATGGAYMGDKDGALVYVTSAGVPAETASYLTAASASIESGIVFGGTTRVPESVRAQISDLIN